jgi:serralysin
MYRDTANSNPISGVDLIEDFVKFQDRIDLSAIDANTAVAGNQVFIFSSSATTPSTGVVTYKSDGYVFAATDSDANWDLVIQTDPNLGLGASDFIL